MKFNYHSFFLPGILQQISCGRSGQSKFHSIIDAGHGGKDPGNSPWLYRKKKLKTTLRVVNFRKIPNF
jgi:N-acetylmuramoyl-L-alanine amidase